MNHIHRDRAAFTLIEMLVVIVIIMILAAMAVMFVPNIQGQQRAAQGGSVLQSWLAIAKQKALRDQVPGGLRLLPGTAPNNQWVVECQYIVQPEDVTGIGVTTLNPPNAPTPDLGKLVFTTPGFDLTDGNPADSTLWLVQPGDYIELFGTGLVRRVQGILSSTVLQLASPLPYAIYPPAPPPPNQPPPTGFYRVMRRPRPIAGDKLLMPTDIAIDVTTNAAYNNPFVASIDPAGNTLGWDILFAPSGRVIGDQAASSSVILWVRDVTLPIDAGTPSLITIYTRSGLTAAHPVDSSNGFVPGTATPYTFTLDGRSSGL